MGQKAEKIFGRKNFLELYAVFSSPLLYRVLTQAGRDIGSLEQDFVDRLVVQMSSFLLGGRAWAVERVSHQDRTVIVREAPGGQKPTWGGHIPQFLGFDLCQRIKRVHTDTLEYPYLSEPAREVIQSQREELGELLRRPGPAVQLDRGTARWWTFAGGRVNQTLKYGLEILEGWKVVSDNFMVRIEGDGVNHDTVRAAIKTLSNRSWWDMPKLLSRLPEYRLSKFQPCLPERYALEVVGAYLLDVEGTVGWVAGMVQHQPGEG